MCCNHILFTNSLFLIIDFDGDKTDKRNPKPAPKRKAPSAAAKAVRNEANRNLKQHGGLEFGIDQSIISTNSVATASAPSNIPAADDKMDIDSPGNSKSVPVANVDSWAMMSKSSSKRADGAGDPLSSPNKAAPATANQPSAAWSNFQSHAITQKEREQARSQLEQQMIAEKREKELAAEREAIALKEKEEAELAERKRLARLELLRESGVSEFS